MQEGAPPQIRDNASPTLLLGPRPPKGETACLTPLQTALPFRHLAIQSRLALGTDARKMGKTMGIDTERDIEANLQIGPTDRGMVRLFVEADGVEIPMDFEPEEAEDIADEIRAAAQAARGVKGRDKKR